MVKTKAQACVQWIKEYYKDNPDGKAIIGISGGKDSTIAAALCVEALGADRVVGVLMPNTVQNDIDDSIRVCKLLEIEWHVIDIGNAYYNIVHEISCDYLSQRPQIQSPHENPMIKTNLPARIRMTTLYAVAALYPNSRVVNTCNRSEDYVGYSTKYGDAAGDFSPLGNLTVREVLEIGDELDLPEHLVHKAPSDGMCGKTDEDNLGFTYEQLDDYILGTAAVDEEVVEKIERLHRATRHKYEPMPMFDPTVLYVDRDQLTIDDAFPRRGLRAKSGIMDDYADGGLVTPDFNAAAMSGNAIMTDLGIVEPLAANNVNVDLGVSELDIEKMGDTLQKLINSAGIGLFRGV